MKNCHSDEILHSSFIVLNLTMIERKLLLGDEAIALGAIHAGISGVYAYPGTPSTEITEFIQGHAPKYVAVGVRMKRPRWKPLSVWLMRESVRWYV